MRVASDRFVYSAHLVLAVCCCSREASPDVLAPDGLVGGPSVYYNQVRARVQLPSRSSARSCRD